MTDLSAKLEPCPFCGDPMEDRGYGAIHVNAGDCAIGGYAVDPVKWNTRTRTRTLAQQSIRTTEAGVVSVGDNAAMELFVDAMAEADKAMRKFPQPNYVISKVAEEAGEVVKAAIHCAEGRDTPEHVAEEIRQAMAMLIRLYVEGDQVHGLPPVYSSLNAKQEGK